MYKKYTTPLPFYGMFWGIRKTSWDGLVNKKDSGFPLICYFEKMVFMLSDATNNQTWAVVVAQSAERWFPLPEIPSSNPVMGIIL